MELLLEIPSTLIENFFVKVDIICIPIQLMICEVCSCDMFVYTGQTGHLFELFIWCIFLYHSPELNFDGISINSMDGTGQRDFVGMYNNAAKII